MKNENDDTVCDDAACLAAAIVTAEWDRKKALKRAAKLVAWRKGARARLRAAIVSDRAFSLPAVLILGSVVSVLDEIQRVVAQEAEDQARRRDAAFTLLANADGDVPTAFKSLEPFCSQGDEGTYG